MINKFESIRRKAKKLKELANRGVGGERNIAIQFLYEYMVKHNLSNEDIEDDSFIRKFRINSLEMATLISHCIISVSPFCKLDCDDIHYIVRLDEVDYNEVEYKIQYFSELYLKEHKELFSIFLKTKGSKNFDLDMERELFFTAFLTKHREMFAPDIDALRKHAPKAKKLTKEEEDELERIRKEQERLNQGIKKEKMIEQPPNPVSFRDSERMQEIMKCMKDITYLKAIRILTT